jgi:hypothetical protein
MGEDVFRHPAIAAGDGQVPAALFVAQSAWPAG